MKKQEKTKVEAVDTMPVYVGTSEIALENLIEHPAAFAMPVSDDDRQCAAESMDIMGYDPLTVCKHDVDANKFYVLDGCGRLKWLHDKGAEKAVCNIFSMNGANVQEFCISRNTMRRKVTTGQRVMAYLELYKMQVLDACLENSDPAKAGAKRGRGKEGAPVGLAFTKEAICERIHVSKNDVESGIQLLRAMHTAKFPVSDTNEEGRKVINWANASEKQVESMKKSLDGIMKGETPIRRWRAAAASSSATTGSHRAPTDYARILLDAMKSVSRSIVCIHDLNHKEQEVFIKEWRKLAEEVKEHITQVLS